VDLKLPTQPAAFAMGRSLPISFFVDSWAHSYDGRLVSSALFHVANVAFLHAQDEAAIASLASQVNITNAGVAAIRAVGGDMAAVATQ